MSLREQFEAKRAAGQKLLVPYVCAGDPDPEATVAVLEALAEAGADALELGVPFSDPLMDGPVIQAASHRALQRGMTLSRVLRVARTFTARNPTPLLLMGSVNPILAFGAAAFLQAARESGISACILPDLPLEEQGRLPGLPQVQLAAPNTPPTRVAELLATEPPFLYAVSVLGVTGVRPEADTGTLGFLRRLKGAASIPVLAGFGVGTPERAVELASACDGVVVGSALVQAMNADPACPDEAAARFLRPFRIALEGAFDAAHS